MDNRNKIQSLVLPTDGPGDAPDCPTEYAPCTCEYGRMCHTASPQYFRGMIRGTVKLHSFLPNEPLLATKGEPGHMG